VKTTGIVLAAGRSQRYGPENKLLATFKGKPLCRYSAEAMNKLDLHKRIVATSDADVAKHFSGFEVVSVNGNQSDSLKASISKAIEYDSDRVLIVLADMPNVTSGILRNLLIKNIHPITALSDGERVSVPAVIDKEVFKQLLDLKGDKGARTLLRNAELTQRVHVAKDVLIDLDTPNDFQQVEK